MSTIAEPLNRLRGSGVKWKFGAEQKNAFDTLKNVLLSDRVLVQYDPSLPIKMDSDASKSGLGPGGSDKSYLPKRKRKTDRILIEITKCSRKKLRAN